MTNSDLRVGSPDERCHAYEVQWCLLEHHPADPTHDGRALDDPQLATNCGIGSDRDFVHLDRRRDDLDGARFGEALLDRFPGDQRETATYR